MRRLRKQPEEYKAKFNLGLLIIFSNRIKKVQGALTLALVGLNGVKERTLALILEEVKWFLWMLSPLSERTSRPPSFLSTGALLPPACSRSLIENPFRALLMLPFRRFLTPPW